MTYASKKAFTLIEVIITVGILAVSLVVIFRSFASVLVSVRLSQNMQSAVYLAQDKLLEARMRQSRQQGMISPARGEQAVQGRVFNWEYRPVEADDTGCVELFVKVWWKERLKESPYDVSFYTLMKPALP